MVQKLQKTCLQTHKAPSDKQADKSRKDTVSLVNLASTIVA